VISPTLFAHTGKEYATVSKLTPPTAAPLPFARPLPLAPTPAPGDLLTQTLHQGARQMLAQAIDAEVADYLAQHAHLRDATGKQLVVRNGYLPQRSIQTPLGDMPVQQPRVRDRRSPEAGQEKFSSKLLPPYLRRTKSMEELIPWLYLKGISIGDFTEALQALLGPEAAGLSATTITRLKATWEQEQRQWAGRSLEGQHYVYVWVDGVYFNVRLEDPNNARQCILVMIGATAEGKKELIAIQDGYRESGQSWKELLLDVQHRGLKTPPKVAIGDGSLGFWKALDEVWPTTLAQRCWVHKTANVLNKLPKSVQAKAKGMLHDIWLAPTQATANQAFDHFVATFQAKYPDAVACLTKDRQRLLTFYGFPAEHWKHLRTTNPIESMFGTVRLRTAKTKGCGSRSACLAMVFKLAQSAQAGWRVLNGYEMIPDVIAGVVFADGVKQAA
jgi:transposase-like protein